MKLRHRVRVNVCGPGGGKEAVLETAQGNIRSRLLRRLVGDQYKRLRLTKILSASGMESERFFYSVLKPRSSGSGYRGVTSMF